MATQAFVRRHRIPFSGIVTPTVVQADFDEHKLADGLGRDFWMQAYLDSDSQNEVLTNDGKALVNAPLYMSLITSATPLTGTGTLTFNKTLVLPTGCLVSSPISPAGVVLRAIAGGQISTKASSPGGISLSLRASDGTFTVHMAAVYASALLANQTDRRWSLAAAMTIRAASVISAPTNWIIPTDPTAAVVATTLNTSFDTNATPTISMVVVWDTGDVANTIGLDTLTAEVLRPGGTVT